MGIVTKFGDSGETRLMYGERVSKADLQIEVCGAIDELNSFLGLARASCDDAEINAIVEHLQRETFIIGGELATPVEHQDKLKARVTAAMTQVLEAHIAEVEKIPDLLDDWALPGASGAGAALDVARAVARRAERGVVRLADAGGVPNAEILRYLNRLSDLLWLLGRRYEITRHINGALR
ncbi:MAG TPA: cob(I)yrinic acid a,c-diamide adenosyltransferase [Abditibacteriaceae bacterium]|nr:cob(I)yrinic acid a,c-diamide adenosyltransferase [Abditibacteriaceae bacterium]